MFVTILATVKLLRRMGRAVADPATRGLVVLGVLTLVIGTTFYALNEGWGVLDALYFSVVTLTTIGYGDLHPTSDVGKVFTIVYSLTGIGILGAVITSIAVTTRSEWGAHASHLHERHERRQGHDEGRDEGRPGDGPRGSDRGPAGPSTP
jgi:voltage-gated potassium channel